MHIKFLVLQNQPTQPLAVRAAALLFRLRRVALTSRIICARIALRRCPARSGSLHPPLAALTSGAPTELEVHIELKIKKAKRKAGAYLFSQVVSNQVSSAQQSLTSVFGMGTGGTSASSAPAIYAQHISLTYSLYPRDVPSKLNNKLRTN